MTDADLLRLFGREPFCWTAERFSQTADCQIVLVLTAHYEEDGSLVPERVHERRTQSRATGENRLPSVAELDIPLAVQQHRRQGRRIHQGWLRAFWSIWRDRGLPPLEIEARFWKKVGVSHGKEQQQPGQRGGGAGRATRAARKATARNRGTRRPGPGPPEGEGSASG